MLLLLLIFAGPDHYHHDRVERLTFTHFSTRDGLSQNSVAHAHQDSRGFLWFGTEDGLNRYNGYDFTIFRTVPGDPRTLSGNVISSIAETSTGELWVGTLESGLNRYRPEEDRFVQYRHDPRVSDSLINDRVRALAIGPDDSLWVGTTAGLAYRPPDGGFTGITRADGLPVESIESLFIDSGGVLWIAGREGVARYDAKSGRFSLVSRERTRAIWVEEDGTLWQATKESGLIRRSPEGGRRIWRGGPDGLVDDHPRGLYIDDEGYVWIGARSGLTILNPAEDRRFVYPTVLEGDAGPRFGRISTITGEASGQIWIGGFGGLAKCRPGLDSFEVIDPRNRDLSDDRVRAVLRDSRGTLWVGTDSGLDRLEEEGPARRIARGDYEKPFIWSLMEDSEGGLWVGTEKGLAGLDRHRETLVDRNHLLPEALADAAKSIRVMIEAGDGTFYMGSPGGLVVLEDSGASRLISTAPSGPLPHPSVTTLLEDPDGALWIGTHGGGLARARLGAGNPEWTLWPADPEGDSGPAFHLVSALLRDEEVLWVGTYGGGLSEMHPASGRFRHYTRQDGLPNLVIYSIQKDEEGHLWLASNGGITRLDPETGYTRTYDTSDGLPSNELNRSAGYRDQDGTLYFGSVRGLVVFHPGHLLINQDQPPVVLTGLSVNGTPRETERATHLLRAVELEPSARSLTFDYAALSFIQPEKTTYRYRLEGFEREWQEVGTRRTATYSNLDPGSYRFRVRATNNDGIASEHELSLGLSVIAPWWQTGPAYLLYALLFLTLVGYVVITQRRLAINNTELERRIADRTLELDLRNAELARKNTELAHAYADLEKVSLSDTLTGLGNRRSLFGTIEKEIAALHRTYSDSAERGEAAPDDAFLGIYILDLDNFKRINDAHGHLVGDHILARTSAIVRQVCRESDLMVRWGGDELLILTRGCTPNSLTGLARRLANTINAHPFTLPDKGTVMQTCSIGFTCYPFSPKTPGALSWEATVQIADQALHTAKSSGRGAWVGLSAREGDPGEWFDSIFEHPQDLVAAGKLTVETSLGDPGEIQWYNTTSPPTAPEGSGSEESLGKT